MTSVQDIEKNPVTVANPVPGSAGAGKSGTQLVTPIAGPTATTNVAPKVATAPVPAIPGSPAISGATPNSELPPGDQSQGGPDADFYKALQALNPNDEEGYKDTLYSYYSGKSAADIQAIKDTAAAAELKANTAVGADTSAANADAARRGMTGTDTSVLGSKAVTDQEQAIADAEAAKSTALATVADNVNKTVESAYSADQSSATAYIATKQAQVTPILNSLIAGGASLKDLQSSNPVEYAKLLQYSGGDENALQAAYVMAVKPTAVLQTWITGTNYNQLVTNPVTGKPEVQTFDMKAQVPTNWTANKIGTTTTVMQDPSNPANTIIYTVDPLSGNVSITGTGTGQSLLSAQGITPGSSPSSSSDSKPETASTTVSTLLNVPPTTPLSDAVSSVGLGAIVSALIKNEGGSPAAVQNNPGNVKFMGQAGATDSGVKAPDGGTYASFSTPDAGNQAIASIVQNAASGTDSSYGAQPTLQSFVDKYTNTGSANTTTNQTTGLDTKQYGLLANVKGFDPASNPLDKDAYNYITNYLSTGTLPQTTGRSAPVIAETNRIASRAKDLYQQATGQPMPNAQVLSTNLGLISSNNSLLNNLKVQEGTISKNFGLNLDNLTANNINQAPPVINKIVDALAQAAGNVPIAQYLTQTGTIQNEIGSLLALKNASGTTVADKIAGGDLLPSDLSADQMKQILTTLMKEASNASQTIGSTNENLYSQTDPLGVDPANPANAPGYKQLTSQSFTNNFDGTWTDPNGVSGYSVSGNIMTGPDGTQYDLSQ